MSVTQSDIDALLSAAEDESLDPAGRQVRPDKPPARSSRPAPPASKGPPAAGNGPLKRILQLSVPVMVTLAEQKLPVNRVLAIAVGAIIEFDRRFDCELELVVSNKVIGRGLAIKVGENFGLRVTEIGDLGEKIRALGGG
jgi:flagellar motor switch protein FliN/FliY